MYKIGVIEKIHDKGLELLDKNKKFQYEIIEDISKYIDYVNKKDTEINDIESQKETLKMNL